MSSRRLHIILLAAIALLLIGLVASVYGIGELLTAEANRLVDLKAQNRALQQEEEALRLAKRDIERYAELEKISRAVVPEDKSQAEMVREIVNIATANSIRLGSISFPASTLGSDVKQPGSAAGPAAGSKTGLSQLEPVKNIPGVYLLVVNVNSDPVQPVSYNRFNNFLGALERNRRTAQVSAISLQPDGKNPNLLSFTLTLNGYIKP